MCSLTPLGRVMYICRQYIYHHWFRQWLVAWSALSPYLNQYWNIVNLTLRNKIHWNINVYSYIFISENAFECVVCEMSAILSRPQCVKTHCVRQRLTHWRRVTHICVGKLSIVGSDNGLSPGRRQAIIWTNDGILLIEPLGTKFSEISIKIRTFSFNKMHLKMSSGNWWPFCLGLSVFR